MTRGDSTDTDHGLGLGQEQEGPGSQGLARPHQSPVPRARRIARVQTGPWAIVRPGQEPVVYIMLPGILPWWAEEPRKG